MSLLGQKNMKRSNQWTVKIVCLQLSAFSFFNLPLKSFNHQEKRECNESVKNTGMKVALNSFSSFFYLTHELRRRQDSLMTRLTEEEMLFFQVHVTHDDDDRHKNSCCFARETKENPPDKPAHNRYSSVSPSPIFDN